MHPVTPDQLPLSSRAERCVDADQAFRGADGVCHGEQLRDERFGIVEHDVVAAGDLARRPAARLRAAAEEVATMPAGPSPMLGTFV